MGLLKFLVMTTDIQVPDVVAQACGPSTLEAEAGLCTGKASPGYTARLQLRKQIKL